MAGQVIITPPSECRQSARGGGCCLDCFDIWKYDVELEDDWDDSKFSARLAFTPARWRHWGAVSASHSSSRILSQRDRHRLPRRGALTANDQQRVRRTRMSARRRQVSLLCAVRHESSRSRSARQLRSARRIFRRAGDGVCRQHRRYSVQWSL